MLVNLMNIKIKNSELKTYRYGIVQTIIFSYFKIRMF